MKTYLLRGVPASLRMDSWWMSETPASGAPPSGRNRSDGRTMPRIPLQMFLLLALIIIADWLFWGHRAGLSLVLFAVVIALATLALTRPRITRQTGGIAAAILSVGLLPVLVYVQFLSVVFGIASLLGFAAFCAFQGQGKVGQITRAAVQLLWLAPLQLGKDMLAGQRHLRQNQAWQGMGRSLTMNWLLPALVGTVFLVLLVMGNPMFEHLLGQLPGVNPNLSRLMFWAMILAFVWPFLTLDKMRHRMQLPFIMPLKSAPTGPAFLNADSVRNSLVLFNLMFASQTALDVIYLWGGAELPDGMTLASYAHRGAYPLVATALLAGLFALISRPYVQTRRFVKTMLLLWLAQNLALVGASVMRLQLYVDSFGLTYLRVAAFIWMTMVAAGLVLIGGQLLRHKGNHWLMMRIGALLVAVLYLSSLINFANFIAANNLARAQTYAGFSKMDRAYTCQLGPMALPAISRYEHDFGRVVCSAYLAPDAPLIADWREWGFRKWQVRRYLVSQTAQGTPDEPKNTDHR